MKAVMLKRPVTIHNQALHAWQPHLMFDQTFDLLLKAVDRRDVMAREVRLPIWDGTGNPEKLLIFGGGGTGDRVQQTPAMRKLAERLGTRLDIAAGRALEWVGLDYVGNVYDWMLPESMLGAYDAVCSYENILGHDDEREVHLADLFAQRLHVGPLEGGKTAKSPREFRCDWNILPWEQRSIRLPEKDNVWIALQMRSNGQSRNWPTEHIIRLAEMIGSRDGWTCILIGAPGEMPVWRGPDNGWAHVSSNPPEGVVNLCGEFPSIRQLAVFLSQCDLLIGPDSGPMHMAGALDVPSICLYGPHTYGTRGKWFPYQTCITTEPIPPDDRCPCHCHSDQINGTMPCGHQYCQLLQAIAPEVVLEQVEDSIGRPRRTAHTKRDHQRPVDGVVKRGGDAGNKRPRRLGGSVPSSSDGSAGSRDGRPRTRQPAGADPV